MYLKFTDWDKDGVPSMRTIGDLIITLENKKEEGNEIRTKNKDEAQKNLGHWKEQKNRKQPKKSCIIGNNNNNIRINHYIISDTKRSLNVISRSVLTNNRISARTDILE